jgi:hypothetical protein
LYRSLVTDIIAEGNVDFVFEEATGTGPTIAEEIAENKLRKGHYLDVDAPAVRKEHGIGTTTRFHELDQMPRGELRVFCIELIVAEQQKRETLWLQAMQGKQFNSGLLVCGLAHLLSMAFRLESSGYSVKARIYNPEHRLCERTHHATIPGLVLRNGDDETPL